MVVAVNEQTPASLYERISEFLHAMVPECSLRAGIFDWLPRVRGRGADKTVRRVSESDRAGQQKQSHYGLSWLRLTVAANKNVAFSHRPGGGDLDRGNAGRLYDFLAVEISDTWSAYNNSNVILLTLVATMESVCFEAL